MAREYKIGASSLSATYTAGTFVAESAAEAIDMARDHYRDSPLGRQMKDVGAFRFYVRSDEPRERDCDCD